MASPAAVAKLEAAVANLEKQLDAVEAKLGGASSSSSGTASSGAGEASDSVSVSGWDAEVAPLLNEFYALSAKIGGQCAEQAKAAEETMVEFRSFLVKVAQEKPADPMAKLGELIGAVGAKLQAAQAFTESHALSDHINHLKTVAEGLGSLSWCVFASCVFYLFPCQRPCYFAHSAFCVSGLRSRCRRRSWTRRARRPSSGRTR
jgi:CAP, N-terminal domain